MSAKLSEPVVLAQPITRDGADPIATVSVRKPDVGALRGLKLFDVLQMDVNAMARLLPRITSPALLPDDVETLDPQDLMALSAAVVGFFAPDGADQATRP